MLKYTVPSSETKNNQTKSSEFVNRSRFISIDSEESQDTSNHIMERNSVHLSKTPAKDIKTRKFEDESTGSTIFEFSIELPNLLTSFENFESITEPLIEKIEDFICNDGKKFSELTKSGKQESFAPSKQFHVTNAVHFTGAILLSLLKFFHEDRKLVFRMTCPGVQSKGPALHEQVLKAVMNKMKKRSKSPFKSMVLSQEFTIHCQEEFDPFIELDEEEVLSELVEIIGNYEGILKECQDEHRANFFHKIENIGELLRIEKTKKKKKDVFLDEAAELNRVRAEQLLKDMRNTEKSPQKGQGAMKRPRKSPKEPTELFGGEIEVSECGVAEKDRAFDSSEQELQEMLINEYNHPTDQSFLMKLRDILAEKSSLKISLCTAMLMSIVFNQRASAIKEVALSDLSSFISISNFIPFPATSALKTLNRWYFLARCIDRILSVEIENCMPRSAYFPAIQEFDHETYAMNVASANIAPKFLDLYTRPTITISTPVSDKLALFANQLCLLNKIFEFFTKTEYANKENGLSLTQLTQDLSTEGMEQLLEEARDISAISEYAEYEHLGNAYYKIQRGMPINQKTEKKPFINYKKNSEILNSVRKEELNVVTKSLKFSGRSQNSEEQTPKMRATDEKMSQSARVLKLRWSSDKSSVQSNNKVLNFEEEERGLNHSYQEDKMDILNSERSDKMDLEDAKSAHEVPEVIESEMNEEEPLEGESAKKPEHSKDSISPNDALEESKEEGKTATKKDGKTKKVEKEFERNMKGLMKKPSLVEARNALEGLLTTGLTANAKKKREKLAEQLIKTEEWLELYRQNVEEERKPLDQLKELIQLISEVPLRTPEMERLYEQQRDAGLWRIKFDALLKKHKKPKKKNAQTMGYEEFEGLFQEADNLRIADLPDEPKFKEMKDKYDKTRLLKQKLDSCSNDLSVLRKIKKELNDPELSNTVLAESVAQRIELNEQVVLLLETNIGVDTLEEFLEQTKDKTDMFEPYLYQKLQEKADEGNKFKAFITSLGLPRTTYEYQDVNVIKSNFSSLKNSKLEIPHQQLLSDILSSFTWLVNLEKLIQTYNEMNPKFNHPKNQRLGLGNLDERFETEEIFNFCSSWILSAFNPRSVDDNTVDQLKLLLHEGSMFRIADQRIEALYKFLNQEICEYEAAASAQQKYSVQSKEKNDIEIEIEKASPSKNDIEMELEHEPQIIEHESEMIEQEPEMIEQEPEIIEQDSDVMIQEMDEDAHILQDWTMLYNKVVSLNVEAILKKHAEAGQIEPSSRTFLVDLRQKLLMLLDEYENSLYEHTELEEKVVSLRKYQEWLDWLVSCCEWSNDTSEKSSETLRYLQEFYQLAKRIEVPKHWGIYKQIEEHFTLADSLLAEYKQKFQQISRGGHSKSPLKDSIQKQIEANKLKPLVSDAKKLRNSMRKKLTYISCEQELGNLDRLIEQYSKWKSSLDLYVKNNSQRVVQAAVTSNASLNDSASIEQQLNQLKTEYLHLSLRDEQDEKTLIDLDSQFRSYVLMKNSNKTADLKEWKKMVKYAEENSSNTAQADENALMNRLKTEYETSKNQHNIVKDLRQFRQRPEKPLPLSELKKIYESLTNSPIRIPEDEQFLEELIQRAEKLKNQARQLLSPGKKKPLIEFTSTLDQIKHLIIYLPEEEKLLEDAIGSVNKISTFIRDNPKLNPAAAERILSEYNNCPVTVLEGEKLLERYEKSKALYETLKAKLIELDGTKCNDYDQLKEISNNLDEVHFNFEGSLPYLKAQAYNLRVRHLQNLAEGSGSNKNSAEKTDDENDFQDLLILSSQTIKSMVREGYSLKRALVEPQKGGMINQAVFWIENISKRIDDKVREINTTSSVEVLDRMPKLLLGFIDLSQHFIERKAAIAAGISLNQTIKPTASTSSEVASVKSTAGSLTDLSTAPKGPQRQLSDFFRDKKEAPKKAQNEKPKEVKKEAQQDSDEKKRKLQLKLIKSESEKNEKKLQLNLQPSKPVLKPQESKPKISDPVLNQAKLDKMFNISKSNQADEAQKQQDKLKRGSSGDLTMEVSKDNASKPDLKKSKAMLRIREILQNNNTDLSFDASKTTTIATRIVTAFPILDQSKEKFAKFEAFFKEVTKLPNIYRMLTKKSFPPKILSILFAKSSPELLKLEKKLANKPKEEKELKETKGVETKKVQRGEDDIYEGQLIKKKLKESHGKKEIKGEKENKEAKPEKESKAKEQKNPLTDLLKLENSLFGAVEAPQAKSLTTAAASLDSKLKGALHSKAKMEISGDQIPSPILSDVAISKKPMRIEEKKESVMMEENEEDLFSEVGSKEVSRNFNQMFEQPTGMDFEDASQERPWYDQQNKQRKTYPSSTDNYPRTPKPYDPEEEFRGDNQFKNNQFLKNNFKGNTFQKAPLDAILKVFDGVMKEVEEESSPSIGLYTCAPLYIVRRMPQIQAERDISLFIEGKMALSQFEPYINKYVNNFDNKQLEFISGWVESLNPSHQDAIDRVANNFLATNKVGVTKFLECTKLFFLHRVQFRREWMERFKFKKRNLQRNSNPQLYFLLMFQPNKLTFDPALLKRIEPEILAPYRENPNDWRNRKWNQNVIPEPDAPKSGRSTPEIELCSKSMSQDNVEKFAALSTMGQNDMNAKKQQSFQANNGRNNRKAFDYDPYSAGVDEPEQSMPPSDSRMEIEKPVLGPKEKEISFDTQQLLNQPLVNFASQSDAEPPIRDPRQRKGFNDYPKTPNGYQQSKNLMNTEYPKADAMNNAGENKQIMKPKFYETTRNDNETVARPPIQKPENPRFEQQNYQTQDFNKPVANEPHFSPVIATETKGFNQSNQNGFQNPLPQKIPYDPEEEVNDNLFPEADSQNPDYAQETQNDDQFEPPKFPQKTYPQRIQSGFKENPPFARGEGMANNQYPEQNNQNNQGFNANPNQNRAGGGFYSNKTTQYPRYEGNNMNNKASPFRQQNLTPQFEEEQNDQRGFNSNSFDRFPRPQNRWQAQTPRNNMNNFQQPQQQAYPAEENPEDAPEFAEDPQQEQLVDGTQNYDEPVQDEQFDENYNQPIEQYNQPRFGGRFNQNFRAPMNRPYDNRNNFQKPFNNNRPNFNNNYNGGNFQRNRFNGDGFGNPSGYNPEQTPRRFSAPRFNPQQTPNRFPQQTPNRPGQFGNRPPRTFNTPRNFGNPSFRQYNNNQDFYPEQPEEENPDLGYEQEGNFSHQNKGIGNQKFAEPEAQTSYPSYKQENNYPSYKTYQSNFNSTPSNNQPQKKTNAENSIFGKARMNLLNASNSKAQNSDL